MPAIYLVRHGQASFGAGDYDRLSRVGKQQARVLGEALAERQIEIGVVVSGAMRRHRDTAEECLRGMRCNLTVQVDARFNEYDHQAMLEALDPRYRHRSELLWALLREGSVRRGFQVLFAQAASRWASGAFDDDYDESFSEFSERVGAALQQLHSALGKGQNALVFSSGGAISALVGPLLGLSPERTMELSYTLANASVTKILVGARGLTLSSLNEHSHFEVRDRKLVTYR